MLKKKALTFAVIDASSDVASLNVLAFHDSVEEAPSITDGLVVGSDKAFAEFSKILGGDWADVVKKLDDYHFRGWNVSICDLKIDVGAPGSVFDGILVSISSHFLVDRLACVVDVSKLLNGPLEEVLHGANISLAVEKDNEVALVLVEIPFLFVLKILKIVDPLGLEEKFEVFFFIKGN